jgi:hypothetical protein
MTRAAYITSEIKKLDHKLFCEREADLFIVKRKKWVPRAFELEDGSTLTYLVERPHNILYLTHNWSLKGKPVDWGVDQVITRLNAIDTTKRDIFREVDKNNQKLDESQERDMRNEIEAWAYDSHSAFKKDFSQINTSTVEKKDLRRLKDKQIK